MQSNFKKGKLYDANRVLKINNKKKIQKIPRKFNLMNLVSIKIANSIKIHKRNQLQLSDAMIIAIIDENCDKKKGERIIT